MSVFHFVSFISFPIKQILRAPGTTLVTLIVFLSSFTFCVMAYLGWPFAQTAENCYDNYLTEEDCFCERPRGNKAGDVWIAQPANTFSNIAYVIIGFLMALACDYGMPTHHWVQYKGNPQNLKRLKFYGIFFACIVTLMGPCSAALHASLTTTGRAMDLFCMYLISSFMVLYSATRKMKSFPCANFVVLYVILTTSLLVVLLSLDDLKMKRNVFYSLNATSILIEIYHGVKKYFSQPKNTLKGSRLILGWFSYAFLYRVASMTCFGLAVAIWIPSKSNSPLCFPESAFQGHAIWHILSAIAIGFIFLYALSCQDDNDEEEADDSDVHTSSCNEEDTDIESCGSASVCSSKTDEIFRAYAEMLK